MSSVVVGKTSDVKAGEGKAFDVGSRCIAVFNIDGKFYALDDTCPHKGASLASGFISATEVTCALHSASFALCDGQGLGGPCGAGIASYPVVINGEEITLEIPD